MARKGIDRPLPKNMMKYTVSLYLNRNTELFREKRVRERERRIQILMMVEGRGIGCEQERERQKNKSVFTTGRFVSVKHET